MEIDKRQKRMLIVLGVVLAYAVFELITNSEQYFGYYMGSDKAEVQAASTNQVAVQTQTPKRPGVNEYDKDWGEDPFYIKVEKKRRSGRKVRPTVRLNLSAISFGGGQPVAMINDEILSVNDVIAGYKVQAIEPKRVILVKGSDRRILTLQ
jgi:hypothetical protein